MEKIATHILSVEYVNEKSCVLLPDQHGRGVCFSKSELRQQWLDYARLYPPLISVLASHLSAQQGIPLPAATVFSRAMLVPVVHWMVDRSLRMDRLLQKTDTTPEALIVGGCDWPDITPTLDSFPHQTANSAQFNQALCVLLAPLWRLPVGESVCFSARKQMSAVSNHNFSGQRFFHRWWRRGLGLFSRPFRGEMPSLSMSYATNMLRGAGVYGRWLSEIRVPVDRHHPVDLALRKRLFSPVATAAEHGLVPLLGTSLAAGFVPLLQEGLTRCLPTALIEGAASNWQLAHESLQSFKPQAPLWVSQASGSEFICAVAAAKAMNKPVIGVQHGGLYGYIKDRVSATVLEYPYCDKYLSWGWEATLVGTKVSSLPSPWLSDRAQFWRQQWSRHVWGQQADYEMLLMSNKVYRFPRTPNSGDVLCGDHAVQANLLTKELIEQSVSQGLRVLHKAYDDDNRRRGEALFGPLLKRYETVDYDCVTDLSKGLHPELLTRCKLVVWDHPGTGFLECLSSGIPVMVFWPRLFSEEVDDAKVLFSELEQVGIVHRKIGTLTQTARQCCHNPQAWWQNEQRVAVVTRFVQQYAQVSPHWQKSWREMFNKSTAC